MNEFLERVLRQLSGYLGQVLELLSYPKTFIEKKDLNARNVMDGNCLIWNTVSLLGHVSVDGATFTLAPKWGERA